MIIVEAQLLIGIKIKPNFLIPSKQKMIWNNCWNKWFEITYTPVAAGCWTITTKRNNTLNNGFLKGLNKTKESHVVNMYLLLLWLFKFCHEIKYVLRGVTHQLYEKVTTFPIWL